MTIELADQLSSAEPRIAPGPKLIPYLGIIRAATRDPLRFFVSASHEYGRVVRFNAGKRDLYLLSHPDDVAHVLQLNHRNYVKSEYYRKVIPIFGEGMFVAEGEAWRRKRAISQPALRKQKIDALAQVMTGVGSSMLDRWEESANAGMPLDIAAEMMRASLLIVIKAFFSRDFPGETSELTDALTVLMPAGEKRIWSLVSFPLWVPTPANIRVRRAIKKFDNAMYELIDERRDSGVVRDDLLSMFLDARFEDTGEAMTNQQLRDELMTMVIAGHETTAMSIAWSCYLLSRNPLTLERLNAEVDTVLGQRLPTTDDLAHLNYTKMVVLEAMRLYPPFWTMSRTAVQDDEIGGYSIPAGSTIMLCPYVVHRSAAYWDNPEGFDPERFSKERSQGRPNFAHFPFGGGPRACIGRNFAMMEATLLLAMIAQRYSLHVLPGHPVEPKAMISLRPRDGIKMTLHRRAPAEYQATVRLTGTSR